MSNGTIQKSSEVNAVRDLLERSKDRLAAALDRALTPDRVIQVTSTLIYKTPALQACTRDSIYSGVIQASELGLDLNPTLGEAYLVPRWNKQVGANVASFQIGYQGLLKLARQSGEILAIRAEIVREGDEFEFGYTPDLHLSHIPRWGESSIVGAYAVAKLKSGERQAVYLPTDEIEAIRARSVAGKSGPWVTDWAEMAKKTAIRRLCKQLPRSLTLAKAIEVDELEFADGPRVVVSAPPRPGLSRSQRLAETLAGPETSDSPTPALEGPGGDPGAAEATPSPEPPPAPPFDLKSSRPESSRPKREREAGEEG